MNRDVKTAIDLLVELNYSEEGFCEVLNIETEELERYKRYPHRASDELRAKIDTLLRQKRRALDFYINWNSPPPLIDLCIKKRATRQRE